MTGDKRFTCLTANKITAKVTRLTTLKTEKHFSLDSKDDSFSLQLSNTQLPFPFSTYLQKKSR